MHINMLEKYATRAVLEELSLQNQLRALIEDVEHAV